MIRPSSLQIAEKCGVSHRLAAEYPEKSEYSAAGDEAHVALAELLRHADECPKSNTLLRLPALLQRAAAIIRERYDVIGVEVTLSLATGDPPVVISSGTTDVLARDRKDGVLTIIDHKTGRPERVTPARDNLQLHAYGLAAAFQYDEAAYRVVVHHVVDGKAWLAEPCDVSEEGLWAMFERIKAAVTVGSAEPAEAYRGSHCDMCFQQSHCPAFMLPAFKGPAELEPFTKPGGLTKDNVVRALRAVEAMETATDIAKDRLKAWSREHGPVVDGDREWAGGVMAGRRKGPTVKECEELGLAHLIKPGDPFERFGWRKR